MLPTRDVELVDKSAGLVQRKRFSAAHARSREAHQDRWYRQLQLRGSVTRFLLVEEAQHRLPYARFLYLLGFKQVVTGILSATASPSEREAWFTSSPPIRRPAHPAATC